jgi:hypothetical protein
MEVFFVQNNYTVYAFFTWHKYLHVFKRYNFYLHTQNRITIVTKMQTFHIIPDTSIDRFYFPHNQFLMVFP